MCEKKKCTQELYTEVKKRIETVDFDTIWKGFHAYDFALYDDEFVYMEDKYFPVDNRFNGNTSILFEGRHLAIWNVCDPAGDEDKDILCANLVHEMFHAFQQSKEERRYPNDLAMLCLPEDISYYQQRLRENQLLCKAFTADNIRQKRLLLQKLLSSRRARQLRFGDIVGQEFCTETIEGLAEYAGSMALRQLSPQKYQARIQSYQQLLSEASPLLFDIRRLQYYAGALFCLSLRDAGIGFWHDIREANDTLSGLVYARECSSQPEGLGQEYPVQDESSLPGIQAAWDQYQKQRQARFDGFAAVSGREFSGCWQICGYDPMNMIRQNDRILCSRFVILAISADTPAAENSEGSRPKPLYLTGPVLLTMKPGTYNEVLRYCVASPESSV